MFARTEGSAAEHVEIVRQDKGNRCIRVFRVLVEQRESRFVCDRIAHTDLAVNVIRHILTNQHVTGDLVGEHVAQADACIEILAVGVIGEFRAKTDGVAKRIAQAKGQIVILVAVFR